MTLLEAPSDFQRDRYERPLILVDGKRTPYQRPSSLGNCIDDRYNIERWQQRMVAQGLATDHATYATAVSLEIDEADKEKKKAWNQLVDKAQAVRRSDARAELGTALHKMTERIDRGETLDLPPVFAKDIAAYHKALEMSGLTVMPGMIECRCACDELTAAGSFDRILVDGQGTAYIGDLKTGDNVYPHGFAVQLATYAHADLYDVATDERTPMPATLSLTQGIIVHLPAGKGICTVEYIDLDKGWEAAKVAHWVRNTWQKDKRLLHNIITVSAPDEAESVATPTPALRSVNRPTAPTYEPPDEGPDVEDGDYTALEATFTRLTSDQKLVMTSWITDGKRAGRHWKLNQRRSVRRFECYRAAIALLEVHDGDDELARACLRLVLDEDVQGTVGAAIGSLTIDQAFRLEVVARATASAAASVGEDNVLRWDTNTLAKSVDPADLPALFAS